MPGTITITRRKHSGYQRSYAGTVQVCCHQVKYSYDITGIRLNTHVLAHLEAEAEERSRFCINEEYWSGELNCLIDGEVEVLGWWEIARD